MLHKLWQLIVVKTTAGAKKNATFIKQPIHTTSAEITK